MSSYFSLQMTSAMSYNGAVDFMRGIYYKNSIDAHDIKIAANMGMHELTDAHHTDPTGIALAIAAGATELFAFLNSKRKQRKILIPQLLQLFNDGPGPSGNADCRCRIFTQSASVIEQQVNEWIELYNPSKKLIEDIRMGTLIVSTVNNALYGVSAGLSIQLHIVLVASNVLVAEQVDFLKIRPYEKLGEAVAEVRDIIIAEENDAQVQSYLSYLMPSI